MLCAHSSTQDAPAGLPEPPRLLRLDLLAPMRGPESPVPGLTAAELVDALEGGYANDVETYEAVGKVRLRGWTTLALLDHCRNDSNGCTYSGWLRSLPGP